MALETSYLLMFAKYSVGAQRAAPALARHLLCPKTTLYSAGINNLKRIGWLYPIFRDLYFYHGLLGLPPHRLANRRYPTAWVSCTWMVRLRGRLSKSSRMTCCHVPRTSWPPTIGIDKDGFISAARRWA